jgi:hypothetical protein
MAVMAFLEPKAASGAGSNTRLAFCILGLAHVPVLAAIGFLLEGPWLLAAGRRGASRRRAQTS